MMGNPCLSINQLLQVFHKNSNRQYGKLSLVTDKDIYFKQDMMVCTVLWMPFEGKDHTSSN